MFALHRVNSFLRGRPYSKPLHTKLLDGTYHKYRAVWHKLLAFVYRLFIMRQSPRLYYKLTPAQIEAISQVPTHNLPGAPSAYVARCQDSSSKESTNGHPGTDVPTDLQEVCLKLCISLLDHKLHY